MKKQIKIIMILAIFLIASISTVAVAASADATLTASKSTVSPGDTFTVVYKVTTDDDVTGGEVNFEFDESRLELVDAVMDSNFANMDSGKVNYSYISQAEDAVKSVDLITFTFKVNANATEGTATITAKNNSVELTTEGVEIGDKTAQVTIDASGTGEEVNNTVNNTTVNNTTRNTITNGTTNIVSNSGAKKDNTATNKTIPYTGVTKYIFPGLVLISIAGISYMAYKKNNI